MSDSKVATKRLSDLKPGESGIIVRFDDDESFLRLMEMGFIIGEKVEVVQLAPLGDPMMVAVFGYQVSLRMNEADRVLIECMENTDWDGNEGRSLFRFVQSHPSWSSDDRKPHHGGYRIRSSLVRCIAAESIQIKQYASQRIPTASPGKVCD